jgi:N-methylhydantoinase B
VSPNIRERRDFSVALFDARGRLAAQAAHIPVHLGSAADSVAAARAAVPFAPGDVVVLNDPYAGGTHLPDVTMVRPVFLPRSRAPDWFLVNRAHHADIGGATPGSMGAAADLLAEGLVIPPVRLRARGELQRDVWALIGSNVRGADERRIDLQAQEASLHRLERRLCELCSSWGRAEVARYTGFLMDYSERVGRAALARLRRGTFTAEDQLEDDGLGHGPFAVRLRLGISPRGLRFDWSGTDAQATGGINANRSVVLAASVYALRCLCPARLPTNDGLFRLIGLHTRRGSLVDPIAPAPVAGGNVETSQRLVDVALCALGKALPGALPAGSAGTMSNLSVGGVRGDGTAFSFYETLPGGAGAGPSGPGCAAIQTHMTNTRNTPIEELELRYPLRVRSLTVRRGSGGRGARRGGEGMVKELEALLPVAVTFLGERHGAGPPGARGGGRGRPGALSLVRNGSRRRLPSKTTVALDPGDVLRVETPGGGGDGRR